MTVQHPTRRGFTLLEMVAILGIMTVVLLIGTGLIAAVLRVDALGATTHQRLVWRATAADQFRRDVARATAAPARIGDRAAGPDTLLLATADGSVVYRFADGELRRTEKRGDAETTRVVPLAPGITVEFSRTAGDRPLVTMTVVEPTKRGPARTDVSAALGGDLR